MKYLARILIFAVATFAAVSCTRNNGPNSDIYGMWRVVEIYVDGALDDDYDGDLYIAFQNDVVRLRGLAECYGRWTQEDDYDTVIMWFDVLENHLPENAYFSGNYANVCKVEKLTSKHFTFVMTNDSHPGVKYEYVLEKW